MHNRHASALTKHEADIGKLQTDQAMLKREMLRLGKQVLFTTKEVFKIIADLQNSLTHATEKLVDVAAALVKSDETLRALAIRK